MTSGLDCNSEEAALEPNNQQAIHLARQPHQSLGLHVGLTSGCEFCHEDG